MLPYFRIHQNLAYRGNSARRDMHAPKVAKSLKRASRPSRPQRHVAKRARRTAALTDERGTENVKNPLLSRLQFHSRSLLRPSSVSSLAIRFLLTLARVGAWKQHKPTPYFESNTVSKINDHLCRVSKHVCKRRHVDTSNLMYVRKTSSSLTLARTASQVRVFALRSLPRYYLCVWLCDIQLSRLRLVSTSNSQIRFLYAQRAPALRVDDLIEDLKDGTRLLALLEVLSGEKLVMKYLPCYYAETVSTVGSGRYSNCA